MRTVVVTGGTSGIGRAIALAFAAHGDRVMAAGLRPFEELPSSVAAVDLDVRDPAQVARLFHDVPRLDVLVHAAGVIRRAEEWAPEVFDDVVDVNLGGAMRVCAASHPRLVAAGGGSIMLIGSMLSFQGSGHAPAYSASKGAILQLGRSLAIAWAREGIRVNVLAPGWITTPLTEPLRRDAARSDQIVSRTPLGRWGTPEEVAGPAVFLASQAASFITGAVLTVDGGYLAG